jgi:hypothetical protein
LALPKVSAKNMFDVQNVVTNIWLDSKKQMEINIFVEIAIAGDAKVNCFVFKNLIII